MTAADSILQTQGLQFAYQAARPVLRGVDFTARRGVFTCILGPNGSGKTTLLKCLLGWLRPTAGEVTIDGRPLRRYRSRDLARLLAYVPQFPASAFAFAVRELVLMGRLAHGGALGLAGTRDFDVAQRAMEMTGTSPFAERTLDELSGGEAQCVMIARALAQEPAVMLLDEPTSHLDIRNQLQIYRLMGRLAREQNMAVVCVSHDINLAVRFADELVLMRDGLPCAHGPAAQVLDRDILRQVYGVNIALITRGPGQPPLVWAD